MATDVETTQLKARILAQALANSINAGVAFPPDKAPADHYAHVPEDTRFGGRFNIDFEGETFLVSVIGNVPVENLVKGGPAISVPETRSSHDTELHRPE